MVKIDLSQFELNESADRALSFDNNVQSIRDVKSVADAISLLSNRSLSKLPSVLKRFKREKVNDE